MSEAVNILIDELPQTVIIDDEEYPISTNFRTFILYEMLLSDRSLTDRDKMEEMINLFFPEDRPERITKAVIEAIIDFYRCGKQETRKQKAVKRTIKNKKKVYDFEFDDAFIYSAFVSAYNIDLNEIDYLHWWKFKALFNGLPSDCEFVKIMGYRSAEPSEIKDNKERNRILKLQALYALPDNLTVEEKAAKFGAILGGGMK